MKRLFIGHVKRLFIGHVNWYDHAANMNSESMKGRLKWRNSALVCRHGKRKGLVCVLVISRGRFNIRRQSLVLAGPPISVKKIKRIR